MCESAQNYIAVPVKMLAECRENIPFSVFIRLSEGKFVAIFTPQGGIDKLRLLRYSKRVSEVYILASEKEKFRSFTKKTPPETIPDQKDQPLSEELSEKKRIILTALEKATQKNLSEIIMPKSVTDHEIRETKNIVQAYVKMLSRDPDIVFRILAQLNESSYLCYHSLATSVLSIFICRLTKQFGARLLEIVGMGGLLHDIGKVKIINDQNLTGFREEDAQNEELKKHPAVGIEMVQHARLVPEEVRQIIYQHHERPDGNGYPLGIPGSRIYYPASLVAIASSFSNYIGRKPFGLELSPRDAIRKMLDMQGRFNRPIIRALTQLYRV